MLGIWEYFWDEQEWLDNPAPSEEPVVVVAIDTGAGSGSYDDRAPPDYWDIRANYLSYIHRPAELKRPSDPGKTIALPPEKTFSEPARMLEPPLSIKVLPRLTVERENAAKRVIASPNLAAIQANFARLTELDRKIALLREAIAKRKALNKKKLLVAKKLKKVVQVLTLIDLYRSVTK